MLGAARSCSELLGAARSGSERVGAARSGSERLGAARSCSTGGEEGSGEGHQATRPCGRALIHKVTRNEYYEPSVTGAEHPLDELPPGVLRGE